MAAAFGCASVTHRSSDDVDALCGMWPILLRALADLPQGLLARLADMHPEVSWPFRPVLSHLSGLGAADVETRSFSLRDVRAELLRGHDAPARARTRPSSRTLRAPLPRRSRGRLPRAAWSRACTSAWSGARNRWRWRARWPRRSRPARIVPSRRARAWASPWPIWCRRCSTPSATT